MILTLKNKINAVFSWLVLENVTGKGFTDVRFAFISIGYTIFIGFYEYLWYAQREVAKQLQIDYGLMHTGILLVTFLVVALGGLAIANIKKLMLNRLFLLTVLFSFYVHLFALITSFSTGYNTLFESLHPFYVWGIATVLSFATLNAGVLKR